VDLHHKVYGSGEIVVILHGLFGMSDNWKSIAQKLSNHYSVVLIDLPNHGRSPWLERFDLSVVVDRLYEFLTDHWMYEIRLVGHSLGAKIAMKFALRYPDMVDQLVLVDMGPQAYQHGHEDIFKALLSLDVQNISSRSEANEQLSRLIRDEGTRLFLLKNLKRTDDGFKWKFDLNTLHRDYSNILTAIETTDQFEHPTLFIKGGDSNYLDYSKHSALIKELFPNAELATIESAGHWIHADQPEALEEKLRAFFTS
jgi:pimeloyl-ACP methyl ester carboxylesterase